MFTTLFINGQYAQNMSDNRSQDRRIARTQAQLWQALFELLQEKPWHDINVSQICRRANVARSSFYLHFQNKLELLDFGFESGIVSAKAEIANYEKTHEGLVTLHWLAHHIHSVHGLKKSGITDDVYIFSRFQRVISELITDELQCKGKPVESDVMSFLVGGTFTVLRNWIDEGIEESPDAIAMRLNRIANRLI